MSTKRKPTRSGRRCRPLSDEERAARRERDRKRFEDAIRALQTSDGWQRWIEIRRQNGLSRYSANNQFLLLCDAMARGISLSYVAGYRWWSDNGYQVRKGERALYVLAPIVRNVVDDETGEKERKVVGFRNCPVFDLAQVDPGPEALAIEPPAAEPLSGDTHADCLPKLESFAASIGVGVAYTEQMASESGRGYYRHSEKLIAIRPDQPNAMVRVLLHELGHAMVAAEFSRGKVYDYAEEECIVECTSHIVAGAAGLDTSSEAVSYVAGWGEDGKLEAVAQAARLIDTLANRLEDALQISGPDAVEADTNREEVPA